MPSKTKNKSKQAKTVSVSTNGETSVVSHEEIRGRAYEIYLGRGEQSGHDVDDWLQAESELQRPR